MGSRGCALLLLLGAALPLLGSAAVSPERSLVWGPGLEAGLALPVRYFYIQAVSATGRNFSRSPPGTVRVLGAALGLRALPGPADPLGREDAVGAARRAVPSPPRRRDPRRCSSRSSRQSWSRARQSQCRRTSAQAFSSPLPTLGSLRLSALPSTALRCSAAALLARSASHLAVVQPGTERGGSFAGRLLAASR